MSECNHCAEQDMQPGSFRVWKPDSTNVFSFSLPSYRSGGTNEHPAPFDEWGTTEKPEHQQSTVTVRLHILLFYTLRAPLWSYYYISLSLYCYITPDRPQPRMNSPNEPPVFRSEQCQPTSRSIFSCLYSRQGLFVLWYNTDRIKVAFWYRLVYFP